MKYDCFVSTINAFTTIYYPCYYWGNVFCPFGHGLLHWLDTKIKNTKKSRTKCFAVFFKQKIELHNDYKSSMETWRTEKKNMLVALVTQCLFSSSLALSRPVVYFTADRSLPIVQIFSEVSFFFNPRWVVEHLKRVLVFPFKFPAPVSILKAKPSFPKFKWFTQPTET